MYELLNIPQLN